MEAEIAEQVKEVVRPLKPKLRGALHATWIPVAMVAGLVLVLFADKPLGKLGGLVFLLASVLLYGTSATYHRGKWNPRTEAMLRRMDHANIFVFIAATYTPLALQLLHGTSQKALLLLVWVGAAVGLTFRILWLGAPRWLYLILYIVMGWAAIGWLPQFYHEGGPTVLALIVVGGLLYTAGALVYAFKRPDPSPAWFGYHEIFHTGTVLAFVCHYSAIALVTFR